MPHFLKRLKYAASSQIGREAWPIFALALLLPMVAYVMAKTSDGEASHIYLPLILTGSTALGLVSWYFLIALVRHVELEQIAWHAGNEGAVVWDAEGRVIRRNQVLKDWLGSEKMGGDGWRALWKMAQEKGSASGWVQTGEYRRYVHIRKHALNMHEEGWTLGVVFDQTRDFLRAHQLNYARKRAEDASKAKDRFLAMMNQEIREPLGGISGWSALVWMDLEHRGLLQGELKEALGGIDLCTQGLQTLLVDALEYAALDNPLTREQHERFLLGDLVDLWRESYRRYFSGKDVKLEVRTSEGIRNEIVELRLSYLRKTLMCLMDGAWKYTDKGTIEMRIEVLNDPSEPLAHIRFTVADESRHRTAEAVADVLNRRKEYEPVQSGKFGLGLVQAAKLLKVQYALDITCTDRDGCGVEIGFTLVAPRVDLDDWKTMTSPRLMCYLSLDPSDLENLGLFEQIHWEPSIGFALELPLSMDVYLVDADVSDFNTSCLAHLSQRGQVIIVTGDRTRLEGICGNYQILDKPCSMLDILRLREKVKEPRPAQLPAAAS